MMSNKEQKNNAYNKHPKPKLNPKTQMLLIAKQLLTSEKTRYSEYEMEAKFGTKGYRHITKIDYDNVVKKLKSSGFTNTNGEGGVYSLKVQPETLDPKTGQFRTSYDFDKFRVEIQTMANIQEYCKTNDLKRLVDTRNGIEILKKNDVYVNEESIRPAEFDDFNFRVTYKKEESVSKTGKVGNEIISNWNKSKKQFRYINRTTFQSPTSPIIIDLSVVRSSTSVNKQLIKTYNIDESNVFNNPEIYEIEVEIDTPKAKLAYGDNPEALVKELESVIKVVLSGLQKTNYPVSYKEQDSVIAEYLSTLYEKDDNEKDDNEKDDNEKKIRTRAYPNNFIGPSSKTLQRKNISNINPDINIPNVTEPFAFCVTDKADGDRHLLYVNSIGKIYLINTNMNVIFTGARSEHKDCYNSIIDGELIIHNKNGTFINTYAAFDIYYINKTDVRARPFMKVPGKDDKFYENGVRLQMLNAFVKELKPVSIVAKTKENNDSQMQKILNSHVNNKLSPITITVKKFYPTFIHDDKNPTNEAKYSIFEACGFIWQRYKDGLFPYNVDGLIFTSTVFGVGSNKMGVAGPVKKLTWDYSFKWKPEEFNTIDFLVSTKKGDDGNDIITPVFENGKNMYESTQFNQYKTLILSVGYNEKRHGYINPCQDLLDDKITLINDVNDKQSFKSEPKQFFPSEPYDIHAGLCNVMIEPDANGNLQMFSKERQVFGNGTIVECSYDINKDGLWKWSPLRVRYDKTAEFRNGQNTFGNDYTTADNNWHSIHNPVTEKMITTGADIPDILVSSDVYYNNMNSERATEHMRDFHNLFVKKILIESVTKRNDTLIDFACGKGGDLPKWIGSHLSFVFGVDVAKDNLENRLNGACARYLTYKKEMKNIPDALFVWGNSSKNIRSGKAMLSEKAMAITKSVFGSSGNDTKLGPAVTRQHNKGHDGFNVSSMQFAIHYMFENNVVFYNFMRNIAECTKLNGYFIGTSYDGKKVFNMLKQKNKEKVLKYMKMIKKYGK